MLTRWLRAQPGGKKVKGKKPMGRAGGIRGTFSRLLYDRHCRETLGCWKIARKIVGDTQKRTIIAMFTGGGHKSDIRAPTLLQRKKKTGKHYMSRVNMEETYQESFAQLNMEKRGGDESWVVKLIAIKLGETNYEVQRKELSKRITLKF